MLLDESFREPVTPAPTEDDLARIKHAVFAGDRIQAINIYISITECGLTQAQAYIKKISADVKSNRNGKNVVKQYKRREFGQQLIFSFKRRICGSVALVKRTPDQQWQPLLHSLD